MSNVHAKPYFLHCDLIYLLGLGRLVGAGIYGVLIESHERFRSLTEVV